MVDRGDPLDAAEAAWAHCLDAEHLVRQRQADILTARRQDVPRCLVLNIRRMAADLVRARSRGEQLLQGYRLRRVS